MSKKKHSLEDYQRAGVELYDKLHIDTFPVAAKYIKSLDEIPNGVIRPIDKGQKMSICQAMTQARRWGQKLCITADDNFCTPSTAGFGWVHGITAEEMIESQVRQKWRKDEDAEKRRHVDQTSVKQLQMLMNLKNIGVMVAPLHETPFIPDSIIVYGNGLQMTYIIHALSYEGKKKYEVTSDFIGFGESCGKGAFYPVIFNKPQFVLPGTGDRGFCLIDDHEMAMGLPAKHLFYVLTNLYKTGEGQGLKLPLRKILPRLNESITPGFRYMREVIDKAKEKEKNKEGSA
ncbi:MAG: DUF169 domain-containing protein [Promethearchaeota archaeon]